MGSRVRYEAKVACGMPGCPIVFNIDSPDEAELMADLQAAIDRHQKNAHGDGRVSPDPDQTDDGTGVGEQ